MSISSPKKPNFFRRISAPHALKLERINAGDSSEQEEIGIIFKERIIIHGR